MLEFLPPYFYKNRACRFHLISQSPGSQQQSDAGALLGVLCLGGVLGSRSLHALTSLESVASYKCSSQTAVLPKVAKPTEIFLQKSKSPLVSAHLHFKELYYKCYKCVKYTFGSIPVREAHAAQAGSRRQSAPQQTPASLRATEPSLQKKLCY